jgi:cobalt-zinc-cadmium efflux system membrane fusion protein
MNRATRWSPVFATVPVLGIMGALLAPASCTPHRKGDPSAAPHDTSELWLTADEVAHAQIDVTALDDHTIEDTLRTSGRVAFDDQRVAHVFSPVTGRVARIDAALGSRVEKGSLLAIIQSPDIGQASADLGKADADLIAAEHDYKRKELLLQSNAISAADYEASQDVYLQAKAERTRAQQKAALLNTGASNLGNLGYGLIAPIPGEVIARNLNPGIEVQGQYGGGNAAVELFTIGELDRVWVLADIYERDLARVTVGARVVVDVVAYPDRTFEGNVDWISGTLDPGTRTAKVRCTFDNPDHLLRSEMYATVRIHVTERRALAIPNEAIVESGDQAVAFIKTGLERNGRIQFQRLPILVDEKGCNGLRPVLHGLDKGMMVVTNGAQTLFDRM